MNMFTRNKKRNCIFSIALKTKCTCFREGRNANEAKCEICDCFASIGNKGGCKLLQTLVSILLKSHTNFNVLYMFMLATSLPVLKLYPPCTSQHPVLIPLRRSDAESCV